MFQSFWFNGLLWKNVRYIVEVAGPVVSILLGQWITLEVVAPFLLHSYMYHVSILLGQWITLEDPFYGRISRFETLFQSFWVNGLLWKFLWRIPIFFLTAVSILLGQWITLEEYPWDSKDVLVFGFNPSGSMDYFGRRPWKTSRKWGKGFNPSGSMDYFGRLSLTLFQNTVLKFQSFWVNGLLWKFNFIKTQNCGVSGFQSFWVNGLLWKLIFNGWLPKNRWVSILLGQWITLEVSYRAKGRRCLRGFNPSGSMDYFGRFWGCCP